MTHRILVLGRSGQLARALATLKSDAFNITCVGRESFDLATGGAVEPLLDTHAPDVAINAAAYTAVDRAETDIEAAFALNRDAPSRLAAACARADLPLVHISTDYVFDGEKATPYVETDAKNPQSIYGRSKSEGEDAILQAGARAAIIRTSWVYDAEGQNFVRTMLRLAKERDQIRVVADQFGRPTWAQDLAEACIAAAHALIERRNDAEGVFHYCGEGDATWAEFAEAIMQEAGRRDWPMARIIPITTAEYPTPARRPRNSRLNCTRAPASFPVAPRPWREALSLCVDQINGLGIEKS